MDKKTMPMIRRFNRINDEISALYHSAFKKLGFADSEMLILYFLCDYGTITQRKIIEITGMSKQTVSSAVSRMTDDGWLLRGTEAGHRRDLVLTEKGERLVRDLVIPFMEKEESIFDGWTEEEKEVYLRLNERYRDSLRVMIENM